MPEDPCDAYKWEQEKAADYADSLRPPDPTVHDIACDSCGCTVRLRIEGLGVWFGECQICNIGYCLAGRIATRKVT